MSKLEKTKLQYLLDHKLDLVAITVPHYAQLCLKSLHELKQKGIKQHGQHPISSRIINATQPSIPNYEVTTVKAVAPHLKHCN